MLQGNIVTHVPYNIITKYCEHIMKNCGRVGFLNIFLEREKNGEEPNLKKLKYVFLAMLQRTLLAGFKIQ